MLDPKILEEFGAKMSALLANSPAKDIEKNAKAMMSGVFAKLDLVTREEFDVQREVRFGFAGAVERMHLLHHGAQLLERSGADAPGASIDIKV